MHSSRHTGQYRIWPYYLQAQNTTALQHNVFLTGIHRIQVKNRRSAFVRAIHCQGQLRTPQSVSVAVAATAWLLLGSFRKDQAHYACSKNMQYVQGNHMFRHLRCVFINYSWINQLSNTTIWRLDICCLLHRYQLHVSALMAIFRLTDWQQTCKQLYFGMRLMCGGGGLGLDGGTRSGVCWVGRVMWVHVYCCADLGINYMFRLLWPSSCW